jgi:hypothetical protein
MSVRDAFMAAKLAEKTVAGPVGEVLVRSLTIGGKDRLQSAVMAGGNYRVIVIRECLYDPSGSALFNGEDDVGRIPANIVEPYINEALILSALSAEEMSELEGNSERTPSNGTGSV